MANYKAPLADMRFVMFDLLKLDAQYARIEGGANATRDVVDAILDEAAKFTEQVLAPLCTERAVAQFPVNCAVVGLLDVVDERPIFQGH